MISKPGDLRLGYLLSDEHLKNCESDTTTLSIIGYSCDEGVRRNSGRLGAQEGPKEFRSHFFKMGSVHNPELDIDLRTCLKIQDLGDIDCATGDLEAAHAKLKARVKEALDGNSIPVIIGGGNDQSYPNAAALIEYIGNGTIGVVNIDAHLDVRPLLETPDGSFRAHSGSPFRQLLLNKSFKENGGQLVEFGAQGEQCSMEHAKFVTEHGGQIMWLTALRGWGDVVNEFIKVLDSFGESQPVFVSFDIDAVRGSDAPGVSCPSVVGLTAEEALEMCQEAGKRPNVCMFDISEFNPKIEADRTARLVVNMVYQFALGIAQRK